MDKRWLVLAAMVAALVGVGWGASPPPLGKDNSHNPLEIDLWMDQAPPLPQPALLTLTVLLKRDAIPPPGPALVWLEFRYWDFNGVPGPAGDVQVTGNLPWGLPWQGSPKKGESLKFSGTVLFPREGVWEVAATARKGGYQFFGAPWRLTVTQEMGEFCWPGWPDGAPPRPLGRPTPRQEQGF